MSELGLQEFSNQIGGVNVSKLAKLNANQWYDAAVKDGLKTKSADISPSTMAQLPVGTVVVWKTPQYLSNGQPNPQITGHVAVITENSGSTMTVIESNWKGADSIDTVDLPYSKIESRPDAHPGSGEPGMSFPLAGFILPN